MGDEADIGLVDAHSERDRGGDHHLFGIDERGLVPGADLRLQSGMVGQRGAAACRQLFGDALGLVAAGCIDDARPRLLRSQGLELGGNAVTRAHVVADVGSVEAGDHEPVLRDSELAQDVSAGAMVSGRRQREPWNVGIVVEQALELAVVGAEIMAPLADAMRLVDGNQREIDAPDQPPERVARRSFGCDVEQVELAAAQPLHGSLSVAVGGGQRGGSQAERIGAADLVVHQRDQRRDDQRGPRPSECWELVAKRLAGARRHHRQRVFAGHDPVDDGLLDAAEMIEAESLFEDRVRVGHELSCWCGPSSA